MPDEEMPGGCPNHLWKTVGVGHGVEAMAVVRLSLPPVEWLSTYAEHSAIVNFELKQSSGYSSAQTLVLACISKMSLLRTF